MSDIQPEKLDRKAEYEKAKAAKAAEKARAKQEKKDKSVQGKTDNDQKQSPKEESKSKRFSRSSEAEKSFAGSLGLENRREIPVSTYDLLNNRFGDSNKARYVLIILYIMFLAVYALIMLGGFTTRVAINDVDKEMKMLSTSKQKLLSQFGSSTGLKGVSETDLIDRAKVVSDATKAVITKQADIGTIVNEIKGKDVPGVTITSIDVTRADLKISPNDPKTKDPKFMATQASTYIVTVIGTGKDFPSVVSWSDSIRSIPVLYNVSFARNGLKITLTASVKNAIPAGGVTLLSSFGIGSDGGAPASSNTAQGTGNSADNQTPAPAQNAQQPSSGQTGTTAPNSQPTKGAN